MTRPAITARESTGRRFDNVEFAHPVVPRPEISHVLFDFDGTLSLVREGWPQIMLELFLGWLPRVPGESESELHATLMAEIMRRTGKPTIEQMILIAERICQRGGEPADPQWYKDRFKAQLEKRRSVRTTALASGTASIDSLLIHQVRPLLDHLASLGLQLYLASGTDDAAVKYEAELLDLTRYFGHRIYGALEDPNEFSKPLIVERMLRDDNITGNQLLAFGDGVAEIEAVKAVGGFAIGVASDEANNGSGRVDPWKRELLLSIGADIVIPDYREAIALMKYLLGR